MIFLVLKDLTSPLQHTPYTLHTSIISMPSRNTVWYVSCFIMLNVFFCLPFAVPTMIWAGVFGRLRSISGTADVLVAIAEHGTVALIISIILWLLRVQIAESGYNGKFANQPDEPNRRYNWFKHFTETSVLEMEYWTPVKLSMQITDVQDFNDDREIAATMIITSDLFWSATFNLIVSTLTNMYAIPTDAGTISHVLHNLYWYNAMSSLMVDLIYRIGQFNKLRIAARDVLRDYWRPRVITVQPV